jgi:putative photosynthetic complex assembly protein 2
MNDRVLAALFVLAIWWLSTAIVLAVVWLGREVVVPSLVGLSALAAFGFYGLRMTAEGADPFNAYAAFASAIAVWAWHEFTFLVGLVTGPRKVPCRAGAGLSERFVSATLAVIHHELALAATLAAVVALTWHRPNQVGAWTFGALWAMRLSAKLNLFLGVRSVTEEFVPAHMRYMLSYFRRARANPLMPVSLLLGGTVVVWLARKATADGSTSFDRVGATLVASILALGVLEHLFLAIPVPDALLWRWAIRSKLPNRPEPIRDLGVEVP